MPRSATTVIAGPWPSRISPRAIQGEQGQQQAEVARTYDPQGVLQARHVSRTAG